MKYHHNWNLTQAAKFGFLFVMHHPALNIYVKLKILLYAIFFSPICVFFSKCFSHVPSDHSQMSVGLVDCITYRSTLIKLMSDVPKYCWIWFWRYMHIPPARNVTSSFCVPDTKCCIDCLSIPLALYISPDPWSPKFIACSHLIICYIHFPFLNCFISSNVIMPPECRGVTGSEREWDDFRGEEWGKDCNV